MPVVYFPPPTPPWYSTNSGQLTLLLGGALASAGLYFYFTTEEPKKHRDGKEDRYTVAGLQNIGNTCFANSLLQALASSPAFIKWLENLDFKYAPAEKVQFLYTLRKTLCGLNYSETPNRSAAGVIEALTCHGWNIGLGREQDLYELFNVFVSTWDDELKILRASLRHSLSHIGDGPQPSLKEAPRIQENGSIGGTNINMNDAKDGENCMIRSKEFAFLKAVFLNCRKDAETSLRLRPPCSGKMITLLRCCQADCLKKKVRHDDLCVLSLSIPKSFAYMNSITLDALLRKYFSPEVISDASCDDCKSKFNRKNSGLLKKQGFYKLPQTLVIRIERIAYNPSGASYKRPEHIAFPAVLDVRDHCFHVSREGEYARGEAINNIAQNLLPTVVPETSNASSNDVPKTLSMVQNICNTLYGKNFKYELRAVSEHLGGPDSGHFITYRKALDDENTWFRTSDSCVTRVAFSAVATSQAYLLIYDKIIHSKIPVKVSEDILMD